MGILFKKKAYLAASVSAIIICILMVLFSDIAVMSAKKGIELWAASVLPAMLPFFICVNFMTGIGLISLLPVGLFPFAMSALSGYPMGAKIVGEMLKCGRVDYRKARILMSYCSTSGPAFMIGAVGTGMLCSQTAGYIIAVSHYTGAIINGVVYSRLLCHGSGKRHITKWKNIDDLQIKPQIEETNLLDILTASIFSAFKSMAVILSYIIFFMFILDLAEMSGIFSIIDSAGLQCLAKGVVEMTVGCNALKKVTLRNGSFFATVIISWGGLSIMGQSMSMLAGTGISFGYLVLTKLTHSIFAGIIALFLGNVML